MKPGDHVTFRRGAGRDGLILSRSGLGYDWIVAWENTNFVTHEYERDLKSAELAKPKPVKRAVVLARRTDVGARRRGAA